MDRNGWNARYAARPLVWSAEPNAVVERELRDLPAGRALDLGCGEGRHALWLAARGWRVTAVDFSDTAIDRARRFASERDLEVEWIAGDIGDVPIERDAYDLVVVAFLHTSRAERARWMRQARDALRPGGTFLYVGHDISNVEHGHGGPRSPEVLCAPADVVADLPGFRVLRSAVVERPVRAERGHCNVSDAAAIALDTFVRAEKPKPSRGEGG